MSIWDDDVGMADYSALRPASGAWQDVGGARQRTEALYESMRDPDQKTGLAGIGQALEELNTTMNPEEEKDTQEQDVDALLEVLAASGATQEPDVSGGASQIESSASDRQPGMEEYSPGILRSMLDEVTPKDEESIAGGGPEYTDSSVGESAMQIGLHAAAAPETAVLMGDGVQKVRRALGNKTANSVTQMLKDAKKNPALKKQILKKIAMRGAMAFTGPVGWAILAADLGYNAAKYGSEAGWFGEGDPIGDFEDTVGGGLRGAWDWIKGDGEVGRNTKADGGRIHLNTGGILPWTQAMSSDYANQYYNQFSGPNYGSIAPIDPVSAVPTTGTTPTDPGNIPSNIAPIPASAQQALRAAQGRGPEDRGTWDQRFGQDNQYNRPGVHQGIAYESDDDGVLRVSHVPNSLENVFSLEDEAHPFLQGVYDVGQLVPRTTSFLADLLGFGKDKDDKEAKAVEQAALQKELQAQRAIEDQIEQNRIASALAAQQELAAINSGGDGSDNDNTTQTSTSTGSGGSPSAGGVSLGTSLHGGNQYSGGGGGGGWRDRDRTGDNRIGCFVKGTMIQMADGTEKEITTIEVGEETKGGQVQAKMEFLPERIYDYKGVKVSGSHWVIEDNQFIEVENSKHGVLTDRLETVYCFKTSDNRIWIKDIEFGDFETGSDADWEPHFEMVKQKLNKELREKRL